MSKIFAAAVVLSILIATPTVAHHNMSAHFDFNQRVTHTGVLRELDWRNPHIYLIVDVETDAGDIESWSFEGPPPDFFRRRSSGRTEFEDSIGKNVTVEASRARDGSASGLIREIRLNNDKVITACPQNC
jgi:hypothetical protein